MSNNISTILQLCGGTFPTGGFSQSYGLETYVAREKVHNIESFRSFLESYLMITIGTFEGPAFMEAYDLAGTWEEDKLIELHELLDAMKLTKENKEASNRTGKSLLRVASQMIEDEKLVAFYDKYGKKGLSGPIALGIVCGRLGVDKDLSLESYIFATLNGLIQSGIKLIPLGNVEAQKLLHEMNSYTKDIIETTKATKIDEISNFCPALDIASMQHEVLPTRLYMS